MRPERSVRRRGGFTLLELVLAVTVLAGLTTLVGALWAQTRDWAQENAAHQAALRLDRALALMRDQWAARRRSYAIRPDAAAAVLIQADRLEFVTADPVLFPDWPLVRVAFIIERDRSTLITADSTATLIYQESPITDPAGAGGEYETLADDLAPRRVPLLSNCSELRFERDVPPDPDAPFGAGRDVWAPLRNETLGVAAAGVGADPAKDGADSGERSTSTPADADGEADFEPARAVRVVGVHQGESFSWPFIVAPSR